jgi:hypothetical protein
MNFYSPYSYYWKGHFGRLQDRVASKGVGTVKCSVDGNILLINNVRWVPDLLESIYSLFLPIQCPKHGISPSFEDGLFLFFFHLSRQKPLLEKMIFI